MVINPISLEKSKGQTTIYNTPEIIGKNSLEIWVIN